MRNHTTSTFTRQKAERGGARGSDTVDRVSLEGGSAVRLRPVVLEGVERRLERVVAIVAARGAHRPRRPLVISSGEKQTRTKASVKEVGEKRCTRLGSKGLCWCAHIHLVYMHGIRTYLRG